MAEQGVGSTKSLVLGKGFARVGEYDALIGEDGSKRLFAELYADPDRPDSRPQEAYQSMLASLQPGWSLRILQLFWPDPEPRQVFQNRVQGWSVSDHEGLAILHQGMLLAIQEYPLPFSKRTFLEFALPGEEDLSWWGGLAGLCNRFGLRIHYLTRLEIMGLARWLLNPTLEYDQKRAKHLQEPG